MKMSESAYRLVDLEMLKDGVYLFLGQIFKDECGWEVVDFSWNCDYFIVKIKTPRPFTTQELLWLGERGFMVSFEDGSYVWRYSLDKISDSYEDYSKYDNEVIDYPICPKPADKSLKEKKPSKHYWFDVVFFSCFIVEMSLVGTWNIWRIPSSNTENFIIYLIVICVSCILSIFLGMNIRDAQYGRLRE